MALVDWTSAHTRLPSYAAVAVLVATLSGCGKCVECTATDAVAMPMAPVGDDVFVTLAGVPANHGLRPMDSLTVRPGDAEVRGNVEISCPTGSAACVVRVSDDGAVRYERSGGKPVIMLWAPAAHQIEIALGQRARNTKPPKLFSFGGAVVTCKALGCPVPDAIHVDHTFRVHGRLDFSGFAFVARRRGVSLAEKVQGSEDDGRYSGYRALGGWMDHSFFLVESMNAARPSEFVYRTWSMGHARNDNPNVPASGTATWSGVMSGVVTSRSGGAGSLVNGDATLTVTGLGASSDASVGIEFSNIVRKDTGSELDNMAWSDLALRDGRFGTGNVVHDTGEGFFGDDDRRIPRGDGIFGQFYGPDHEEVGGLFNRRGISGAFAAKRAQSP